jgi:hypothetical protein
VLPLIGALAVVALGLVTAGSAYLSLASSPTGPTGAPTLASTAITDPNHGITLVATWATVAVLVGGYFVACFTGTLFSAALVAVADDRRRGGRGSSADGMRTAALHAPQLAVWSVVAGTVGVVARQFGHRGAIGFAVGRPTRRDWNEATALVLPLIVNEGLGPMAAWRRSRQLSPTEAHVRSTGASLVPLAFLSAIVGAAALWPVAPVAAAGALGAVAVLAYVCRATATGAERSSHYHEAVAATGAPVDEVAIAGEAPAVRLLAA